MKTPAFFKNCLTIALLSGLASPAFADVKDGVDAWGREDYKTAIAEWRGPADKGDADAQFNMAQAYKLGRGVSADLVQAERFYKLAADQGHLQASDNYGLLLFQNNRRTDALPYLTESARRGEPRSQYVLGTGHFNGDFVQKDYVRAYALMTRASAQGLSQATSNMAQMDKYIPIEDRRRAVQLAGQMEQDEQRVRTAQVSGLRPPQTSGTIQTAQLPPSQTPVTPPMTTPPLPRNPQTPPVKTATNNTKPVVQGNWRIQLGAFSDDGKAKALWNNLESKISALAGLQPYLVNAGNITRLQAGPFATKAQAQSMCSKVTASGNACIVKAR